MVKPAYKPVDCLSCDGRGFASLSLRVWACRQCHGTGKVCPGCHGYSALARPLEDSAERCEVCGQWLEVPF
ncbi:hypothetical protein [Methylomagnum ishizawai]|uniref:hypothetical protein n=1 Tax=Methylomagnum ishizawai TaxID=1760988 RepID=UPI001C3331F2|nr:hypothetical protein [Methylomagnum ishizawai]BBL73987.1 hypothetical protein MishRS11D_10850 [Methylomagnum ishizawai]